MTEQQQDFQPRLRTTPATPRPEEPHREYLALLGHELRNPLAAIASAVALLHRPEIPEGARGEALAILDRQVGHLSRLVDDLLSVSRLTRGSIQLERRRLDLGALVEASVAALRPLAVEAGLLLQVKVPEEPVEVLADADRMEQVVGNLLRNALRFTPRGGSVWVGVDEHAGAARLRVVDDGQGIEPELVARIFDPFVTGQSSPADSHGSLGIGLTLVRRLVELHGGRVEAHSEGPGRGAVLVVELPLAERTADAEEARTRVLVVEDHVDTAAALSTLLEVFGCRVGVARDGHQALATAAELRPDLVLLDIGLPGLDGYEVARRLRRDPQLAACRIVALTGYGERTAGRSGGSPFDLYLVKPVDPGRLEALVAEAARD